MNLAQLLSVVVVLAIRKRVNTLKLETVKQWVSENSSYDNYGRGYADNRLSDVSLSAYAEIRREITGGNVRITANVYFDGKQGAAASKTWNVKRLDSKFEKFFGNNLRVRIDV